MSINSKQIIEGFRTGAVELIKEPHKDTGTVCRIGEYWFYFGDQETKTSSPKQYMENHKPKEIADMLVEALKDIETYGDFAEWLYYDVLLNELDVKVFAATAWTPEELITEAKKYNIQMNDVQAEKWLRKNEAIIREGSKRAGLAVIDRLLTGNGKTNTTQTNITKNTGTIRTKVPAPITITKSKK